MRSTIPVLLGAALSVCALGLPANSLAQGKPERSLTCARNNAPFCDVACVTVEGQALFVFDRVQAVFVTEFAGHHTLLEIQRSSPGEIVSVLVGDISHCTFNGLQDPSLIHGRT